MPTYIVDPLRFHAEGALLNWDAIARRQKLPTQGKWGASIQLRWMPKADLGLPTGPFSVWTRPHSAHPGFQTLVFQQQQLLFQPGTELVTWNEGEMVSVNLDVSAPSGGMVFAIAGAPILGGIVGFQAVPAGATNVTISAKSITSLSLTNGITVSAVRGLLPNGYANAPGWTLVEQVGLPVSQIDWAGIGNHGDPQGLVGSFTDGPSAAVARLKRGAPPFGWGPVIAPGVPAPPWSAPDFNLLVKEVNEDLLKYLHDIARDFAPADQVAQSITVPLPPPENSKGEFTNKPGTDTRMFPLPMAYMAASTDPFLNLALGFGTAYHLGLENSFAATSMALDFMVTAHWDKGLDGKSAPVDYAAVIPAPQIALPPPAPANMGTEVLGALRPLDPDKNWRESVRIMWDRPPVAELFRVASCVAARASISPAAPVQALVKPRTSGGWRPLVINAPLDAPESQDPEWWRVHVMDREVEIPSNPGNLQAKYGATVQDIYGQWSPWVAADRNLTQPPLNPVRLANPELKMIVPPSGAACTTSLEFQFLWDWRVRTPSKVTVVGRLFAAAHHGDPPPILSVPAGMDRALGVAGGALQITFSGDVPSAPGVVFKPLTEDGENEAPSFGAAQGTNRRYKAIVSGLTLDFSGTPFIGLALWARGQESIAPHRVTGWSADPLVISTGDPCPPVVPVEHVQLGSIPDANGESHVRIAWTPQPNSVGYFVYEATEAALLDAWGLPEAGQKATLDARLLVLKNHFKTNPVRRPFARRNSTMIHGTSTDIALPRGSKGIHAFVVLGISAGQVESAWPDFPSPEASLIAVAAPHVTRPATPTLEVRQILDTSTSPPTYKARVRVGTRPGPRAAMVEIHRVRVDDAAKAVDTMGPPVARLRNSSGAWTVVPASDADYGTYIDIAHGDDAPEGSWKRVWYRATAWTDLDLTRGGLPGRSEPTNAAWVVVPPSTGPVLSALELHAGPTPQDVVVQWTCASPRGITPMGPHQISVRADTAAAPSVSMIRQDTTLDQLATSQPATGSGIWVVGTTSGTTTYRALLRRASLGDLLNFVVRITDPLGRTGSQSILVPAGPVDPPPDLQDLAFHKVAKPPPGHVELTFTSTSPVHALPDGNYVLHIVGIPAVKALFPPPPSLTIALGLVPTKPHPGPKPVLSILRSKLGPTYTYHVASTAKLKGFRVRLTGPDGTFVEKTV